MRKIPTLRLMEMSIELSAVFMRDTPINKLSAYKVYEKRLLKKIYPKNIQVSLLKVLWIWEDVFVLQKI